MRSSLYSCIALILSVLFIQPAAAQTLFLMDDELAMYCIYFPSGTPEIGLYNKSTNDVAFDDFDAQLQRVERQRLAMRKRVRTLSRMISDNRIVDAERRNFARLYKQILDKKYRGKVKRIVSDAKSLRRRALRRAKELEDLKDTIEDCRNEELSLPPQANGANVEFIQFTFTHPDFGVTYYAYGVGFTASLSKKARKLGFGSLCLATDNRNGSTSVGVFPNEKKVTVFSNLCSGFAGTFFRNPLSCSAQQAGLPANTGVLWEDVFISTSPASDSRRAQFDRQIEDFGNINGRAFLKKRGCRGDD